MDPCGLKITSLRISASDSILKPSQGASALVRLTADPMVGLRVPPRPVNSNGGVEREAEKTRSTTLDCSLAHLRQRGRCRRSTLLLIGPKTGHNLFYYFGLER